MAALGELECRPVFPCGDEPWGEIPIDDQTVFVDGSYGDNDSDGSASRPWPTIGQALTTVPAGGLVAIAEGSYVESVQIVGQQVRLWGRCPERVHWRGVDGAPEAITLQSSEVEVHGVSISGPGMGIFLLGGSATIDRVWIHDTGSFAVGAQNSGGPTSVTLTDSLVEGAVGPAVFVGGSLGLVERTEIRDTRPGESANGFAVSAQENPHTLERASVTVRSSVLWRNTSAEILTIGSDLVVQSSLLADTRPRDANGSFGRGLSLQEGNVSGQPTVATVESSVIENVRDSGVFCQGSSLSMTSSVVRGVQATGTGPQDGRGVALGVGPETGEPSQATIQGSLIDGPAGLGVVVVGSHATIESTLVRDVQPRPVDGHFGRGVHAQPGGAAAPSSLALTWSVVEQAHDAGVVVLDCTAEVLGTRISATRARPADSLFGDGLIVMQSAAAASVVLEHVAIRDSARAGLGSHAAHVAVLSSSFQCNPIQLDGEPLLGRDPQIEDRGGNVCGCDDQEELCAVRSAGLAPPDPLPE
jgi:hypothetical protein